MNRTRIRLKLWPVLALALALLTMTGSNSLRADDLVRPVTITMKEQAWADGRVVRLGDIASLDGGPEALRERLTNMDIDDLPPRCDSLAISRAQVQFRLGLAGVPPQLFVMAGSADVQVAPHRTTLSTEQIIDAATEAAYRKLPWPRAELWIRLHQPITVSLPALAADERAVLQAEPHRPNVGLGTTQINVTIRVDGEKRLSLPVFLDVGLWQQVAVCRRQVERGAILSQDDLISERRDVSPSEKNLIRPEIALGKKARRALAAGQALNATDVEDAAAATHEQLVQAGQTVRMTVKLGAIDVVTMGEAIQGGELGQTIRVKNSDSKKIVMGRVTGPKMVELDVNKP
jgi:flagella basal body P-ring formation protein FlgA